MKTVSAEYMNKGYALPTAGELVDARRRMRIRFWSFSFPKLVARPANRLQWLAAVMIIQSVFITPLTALIIMATANWPPLWFAATASMYTSFIPGLSGLDVKWIRKTFLVNLVVGLLIMATALVHYLIVN